MNPPLTLQELQVRFKSMFNIIDMDTRVDFSVIPLHNHFKVSGILLKYPDISTFTIDLIPNIPCRFLEMELPLLIEEIKRNFTKFTTNGHQYTTPLEHLSLQTVFYFLAQVHIHMMVTVQHPPQVSQAPYTTTPQFPFQPGMPMFPMHAQMAVPMLIEQLQRNPLNIPKPTAPNTRRIE